MFRASTAHHQVVWCIYVASGSSKMAVCWLPVLLEVPHDDGLLIPETCRGMLIQ
jgi:hypothetical protein